jgi:hypothetical protein
VHARYNNNAIEIHIEILSNILLLELQLLQINIANCIATVDIYSIYASAKLNIEGECACTLALVGNNGIFIVLSSLVALVAVVAVVAVVA